jgi:hypothetical protein
MSAAISRVTMIGRLTGESTRRAKRPKLVFIGGYNGVGEIRTVKSAISKERQVNKRYVGWLILPIWWLKERT